MYDQQIASWLRTWPGRDQEAMKVARATDDADDEDDLEEVDCLGLAVHSGDDYYLNNVFHYSYWLRFLRQRGELDPEEAPGARLTRKRLSAYLIEKREVSPSARWTYIRGIRNVIKVIDPGCDQKYLMRVIGFLKRSATPVRDQRHLLVPPSDMFYAGIDRMRRVMAAAEHDVEAAGLYEDGLMMSMIVCKALRKRNFVGMLKEKNIRRNVMDIYEVRVRAIETKARRRIEAELSAKLTAYIDLWLDKIRPVLLQGRTSEAMWVSTKGTDMKAATFYKRFCMATEYELDVRVNPHLARKIVATGVAIAAPEMVQMMSSLLDQSTDQSEAYNLADQLSASRADLDLLEQRRREALTGC